MMRIALTGSIGMGKSTVARMFKKAGVPVFDADAEVRKLQGQGGSLVEPIGREFPGTVVNGFLDRELLASIVLEDPRSLTKLERLVHPAVRDAREAFIAEHRAAPALLFEIPLLYETDGDRDFDKVIVVSSPAEVQRLRVLARPGMTEEKLNAILARQIPDADKRSRADFVVETGVDLSTTEAQVRNILSCLGIPTGE